MALYFRAWAASKSVGLPETCSQAILYPLDYTNSRRALEEGPGQEKFGSCSMALNSSRGWVAYAWVPQLKRALSLMLRADAVIAAASFLTKRAVGMCALHDKQAFFHELAFKAACAHQAGNTKACFEIVRSLKGFQCRPIKAVRLKCGKLSETEEERQDRWQVYFAVLFNGSIVEDVTTLKTASLRPIGRDVAPVHVSMEATRCSIDCLGSNRAVGTDEVPASLLKVGGFAVVRPVNFLHNAAIAREAPPIQWKGGRIVDSWKRKKDPTVCDNSCGLLVSDHLAKSYTGVLKMECITKVLSVLPDDQFGGVPGGGTDFANHLIRSLLQLAKVAGMSAFVLFLDLEKAYDRIVRELVFGMPHNNDMACTEYLESIGVTANSSMMIASHLDTDGTVFDEAHVHPRVTRAINALHCGAWFRYGTRRSVISSPTGARQGCKLGGIIFGAAYMRALREVRARLSQSGIVLKIRFDPSSPMWSDIAGTIHCDNEGRADDEGEVTKEAIEATFVDDEALVIIAPSPAKLDIAIDKLLSIISEVFEAFALTINWAPGKSEGMLTYRGKNASKALEKRRLPDKSLAVRLPIDDASGSARHLHIVPCFKHLGGHIAADGGLATEARHRCSSAMQAYVPIASRVFGSPHVPSCTKQCFNTALVCSRLFYNSHTWTPNEHALAKLNSVYMRVQRRIANDPRFSAETAMSDLVVRRVAAAPSVDCIIRKARLGYLCRLVNSKHDALRAVLSVKVKNTRIPWVSLIASDLVAMYASSKAVQEQLPMPGIDVHDRAWLTFMKSYPSRWHDLVKNYSFSESCLDRCAVLQQPTMQVAVFKCAECYQQFPTSKACGLHRRIKHGVRDEIRFFINGSGLCPNCGMNLHSRLRVMAHVQDRRNNVCKSRILAMTLVRMQHSDLYRLESIDRCARRSALHEGHTHPIAVGQAMTGRGKAIGHIQA
jgi:hypothetical protein